MIVISLIYEYPGTVVEFLSLDEFRERKGEFDEAVMATPGIPDCCSGSAWALAAHDTLRLSEFRKIPPLIVHEDGHWLLFAQRPVNQGTFYFEPFEGYWLFTCPLVGPDPSKSLELLNKAVDKLHSNRATCFLLGGIPNGGELDQLVENQTNPFQIIQKTEGIPSMWIYLKDGLQGYLDRRSFKFRKSLRQAHKKISSYNLTFDDVFDYGEGVFDRLMSIEEKSWKFSEGQSIFQEYQFVQFYNHLMETSGISKDLRFLVAQLEGQDIGYIMGGKFGKTYRGWQMSFNEKFRNLSIGNILQVENINRRAEEGIEIYDLGMFAEYKSRWTDDVRELNIYVLIYPPAV